MTRVPGSVLIVGASLAGYSTARALRQRGFDGLIHLVGDELERPYDRPPLSKDFLLGTVNEADLALEPDGEELHATWSLGHRAVALDPVAGVVTLDDGGIVRGDTVVVATGSRARALRPDLAGVHTVRTLADARALREELVDGARLVVIGGGFIGAEIASTAHARGLSVTVVEAADVPFEGPLGEEVGAVVAGLHATHGVELIVGTPVLAIRGEGRVSGVELADGRLLDADVVVVGIGGIPNVEWLDGSGLSIDRGLLCDADGRTDSPHVFGVGDCAAWFDPEYGQHRRIEHWTEARDRPLAMVDALLAGSGGRPETATRRAPYFWSEQYGVRIQYAGRRHGDERVSFEAGSVAGEDLLAVYWRGDEPVAVLGMNQPKIFNRWRRALRANFVARQDVFV